MLTYLSYGVPVVALKQATWGMASVDGVNVASEETFADKIVELLQDPKLREQLSKKALKNINQNHSDKAITAFFKKVKFL